MADSAIGEIPIIISGDFSELQSALGEAQRIAAQAGGDMAEAFNEAADSLTKLDSGQLNLLNQALLQLQGSGDTAAEALGRIAESGAQLGDDVATAAGALQSALTPALDSVESSAHEAGDAVTGAGEAINEAGKEAEEAETGFAAAAEQLVAFGEALAITEGLKEFGEEALTAFGQVQSVTIGLTQLTGSAEEADKIIEQVKELAATEPFAFPDIAPTVQRMVALGVATDQVDEVMHAAANSAAATGSSFDTAANAIDRMALTGNAGARQLVALGISAKDLGAAMDVSADDVKTAFAALDQRDRLDAITQALQKFAGSAEAQAQGIAGQWQIFKNEFEEVMVSVGAALAPIVSEFVSAFKDNIIPAIQTAITWFNDLPGGVRETIVVLGLAAAAVAPLTVALGGLGLGIAGIQAALPALTGLLTALGFASTEAATAETAEATATTEMATAATGATGALTAEATAVEALGGAAATAAGAGALGGLRAALAGILEVAGPVALALGAAGGLAAVFTVLETEAQKAYKASDQFKQEITDLSSKIQDAATHVESFGTKVDTDVRFLLAFADAHSKVAQAQTNLTTNTQALIDKQTALDVKWEEAKAVLANIEANYKGAADYAELHARAVAEVDAAWKAATPHANDHAKAVDAVLKKYGDYLPQASAVQEAIGKIIEGVDKSNAEFEQALTVYAELKKNSDDLYDSDQVLAAALAALQSAANKAGVSQKDLADDIAKATGEVKDSIIVNGQAVQTLMSHADAAAAAGKSVKVFADDLYQLAQDGGLAKQTVDVLTGAVSAQSASVKDLSDNWVYLNGEWTTADDLMEKVQGAMSGVASAAKDAAAAVQSEADAFSNLNSEMSKASSGGGLTGNLTDTGIPGSPNAGYLSTLAAYGIASANSVSTSINTVSVGPTVVDMFSGVSNPTPGGNFGVGVLAANFAKALSETTGPLALLAKGSQDAGKGLEAANIPLAHFASTAMDAAASVASANDALPDFTKAIAGAATPLGLVATAASNLAQVWNPQAVSGWKDVPLTLYNLGGSASTLNAAFAPLASTTKDLANAFSQFVTTTESDLNTVLMGSDVTRGVGGNANVSYFVNGVKVSQAAYEAATENNTNPLGTFGLTPFQSSIGPGFGSASLPTNLGLPQQAASGPGSFVLAPFAPAVNPNPFGVSTGPGGSFGLTSVFGSFGNFGTPAPVPAGGFGSPATVTGQPLSVNITLPNATIYGEQGAQRLGEVLTNAFQVYGSQKVL